MARLVDVGLESKDISIAHRLPVKNGQSKIIVKYTRRTTRDEVYKNHKKLKSKRTKDLPSARAQPETLSVNHNAEIHIPESLTLYRKRLFSRILEFKRNRQYKYLWTSNGKIMVHKSDTSTPQCFVPFEDFDDYLDRISQNS